MKEIPLTKGFVALVDDDEYGRLSRFKWHVLTKNLKNGNLSVYAATNGPRKEIPRRKILMHSEITGYARTDHADGNGLNNQRANLRAASASQNAMNIDNRNLSKPAAISSHFKGVHFDRAAKKWYARIAKDGKRIHLGLFREEVDAATAYNFKAYELFGEFARFNHA